MLLRSIDHCKGQTPKTLKLAHTNNHDTGDTFDGANPL